MHLLLTTHAFLFGAIIGSFLNVVIHRLQTGESLVFPASKCPSCHAPIRWYDNIPIVSYLILRGRCRDCRNAISPRYPLVELANALFYTAIFLRTGPTLGFIPLAAIVSMTIALIFIDLDIQILPDVIDLPGIAVGLIIGGLKLGSMPNDLTLATDLLDSVLGALLGGSLLYAIAMLYELVRKVEGMGLGDVKMLAMIGAVVGWQPLIPLLFIASFTGAIFGVTLALKQRQGLQFAIPFGVFLGMAAFVVVFFGHTLLEWYRSLLLG
ncbi:MAG TPA: prepilin peptidase [Thermoanaerobaculia bacterium]